MQADPHLIRELEALEAERRRQLRLRHLWGEPTYLEAESILRDQIRTIFRPLQSVTH